MKEKSEREVAQSCLTLSDPMDCSPPGSSIHGIFQARVLEWGAIALDEEIWELQGQNHLTKAAKGPGNHLIQYSRHLKGTRDSTKDTGLVNDTAGIRNQSSLLFNQDQFPQTAWLPPQMPNTVSGLLSLRGEAAGTRETLAWRRQQYPFGEKQSFSAFPARFTNRTPPWVLCEDLTLGFPAVAEN